MTWAPPRGRPGGVGSPPLQGPRARETITLSVTDTSRELSGTSPMDTIWIVWKKADGGLDGDVAMHRKSLPTRKHREEK